MIIAVEGCAHGQLENIYESVGKLALERNVNIELLLCCGDFEAIRCLKDLACVAGPVQHRAMGTFYK